MKKEQLWFGLLFLGILLGLWTTFKVYTVGFSLYAKTDVLVWTLPLSTYIFFSLTSSGLAFIASFPVVFGIKRYEVVEKRTVNLEIGMLLGSFVCLILHLGSPLKIVYILLSPNPASPLWWLAILYMAYFILLLTAFRRIQSGHISKALGIFIFIIAIFTSTTLGWLMGMADARPTLNASFFSFYFPLTGLVSGMAALILASMIDVHLSGQTVSEEKSALYNEFARLMGIVAGMVAVLFLWRTISGGISSTAVEYQAFKHMIGSIPYNIEFWLGLVIPTVLMLAPAMRVTMWGKVTASVLILVGMFAGRLEFVLSGVVRPLGQMAEGRPEIVGYMPTVYELFVALFGLSVMLLVYTIGERYLKFDSVPE